MVGNIQIQTAKQTQKVSTKQIQFLNFLFLNQQELDSYISKEMLENPFLEEGMEVANEPEDTTEDFSGEMKLEDMYSSETLEDDYGMYDKYTNSSNPDIPEWQDLQMERLTEKEDYCQSVLEQLSFGELDQDEMQIAHFLVYSADDKGLLGCDLTTLTDNIGFATGRFFDDELIAKVKEHINHSDPLGFCAYDLQDYFKMLIENDHELDEDFKTKMIKVLEEHFEALSQGEWAHISFQTGISEQELKDMLAAFANYKPYPTYGMSITQGIQIDDSIIPDYDIRIEGEELKGELANYKRYNLAVNEGLASSMKNTSRNGTNTYISEKVRSAFWLLDAIRQREETMTKVINAIVKLQKDYLLTGDIKKLRPMILNDVATYIDMNISTVSRVTSNKFAISPWGLLNLKDLFTEAIYLQDGSRKSNREIQEMVINIVNAEDKEYPLSDKEIQNSLKLEGINLTRRTITKYRLLENIPSSKDRKVS